ncbi:SprT-like domain-containing protein [Arcanobacterium haemolyticum]|nr:SprT-like domain-containing protein [Arcanobacterium haemolyticum]
MDIDQVCFLARDLMDRHGLTEWNLAFDRAKRRAGQTNFSKRTISLSAPFMRLYDESRVRDVVLHEIAHALVGPRHAHDRVWQAKARQIGARPSRRIIDGPTPPAPYVGTCPQGHTIERFRLPRRPISCATCSRTYNPAYSFTWRRR